MSVLPVGFGSAAGGGTPANAIERSLRFNSADSAYLNRTPASASNRKTWTWSGWVKQGLLGIDSAFFDAANNDQLRFRNDNTFSFSFNNILSIQTTQVFRDPSAWYHIVIAIDTTQNTASNRIKLYVNGSQVTAFSTASYPAQNTDGFINSTNAHSVGRTSGGAYYFNGYMTEVNFIDGQALTPSSFGETDTNTGVWKPKAFSGTYGTNGFYLPFKTASQWSGFFDGTGDYVTVANNAALNFGTSAFTVECWFYRTASAAVYGLWSLNSVTSGYAGARAQINTNGSIDVYISQNGSSWANSITNRGSTTVNTWNHLAVVRESNGDIKIYINGTQAGATVTNANSLYAGTSHLIAGVYSAGSPSSVFPGYISNLRSVVGTAVYTGNFTPPTSQLTAITNTQLLTLQSSTFVDNSANALTVTAAGDARAQQFSPFTLDVTDDHSGQGNHWIPNNLDLRTTGVGADILVDSPTSYGTDTGVGGTVRGNYCTLNPLRNYISANGTISNGNLQVNGSQSATNACAAGTMVLSGKIYWEFTITTVGSSPSSGVGILPITYTGSASTANGLSVGIFYLSNGDKRVTGSSSAYGATYSSGDIIGIAVDVTAETITFYKNNTSQGSISGTGVISAGVVPYIGMDDTNSPSITANFGQRAFAYTAPSGFKALCTQNLPTPTIGATSTTQANDYFNAVLYTGNATARTITGVGFQPDLVWGKGRSVAYNHRIFDVLRGATKTISSNLTDAESTEAQQLTAFTSDGFSLGTDNGLNQSSATYVAWNWKANGAGVTNTAGTITSTVSANTTSGFSIVTYTGTGANATVGHGIGIAPTFIIVKRRNSAVGWPCLVKAANSGNGQNGRLNLNETATYADNIEFWNNTSPTSTVFSVGISVGTNASGGTYVAYCFAPVAGYSAFGSYTGNGSTDGPFVFTNMRPRFLLVKRTDSADDWVMYDSARDPYNQVVLDLRANSSAAEASASSDAFDFLSNGFKLRGTTYNASGGTYIYAAFAEAPFKYSLGR